MMKYGMIKRIQLYLLNVTIKMVNYQSQGRK